MPKPARGPRLGSGPAHEKLMLSGLAAALLRDERIRTTEAKAKRLRPVAERLITLGKAGTVHARRQALAVVEDRDVVHKLFAEIAPRYPDRNGGYTRILKLGPRKGDAASMALIELIEGGEPGEAAPSGEESTTRRRGVLRRRRGREMGVSEKAATDEEPESEPEGELEPEAQAQEAGTEPPAATDAESEADPGESAADEEPPR